MSEVLENSSNISIFRNGKKPRKKYIRLRNTSPNKITLQRTSIFHGFMSFTLQPGQVVPVEESVYSDRVAKLYISRGLLEVVYEDDFLPPAA